LAGFSAPSNHSVREAAQPGFAYGAFAYANAAFAYVNLPGVTTSRWIAFAANGKLQKINVRGGQPQVLCDGASAPSCGRTRTER
jgi:hypothetical protein